MTVSRKSTLDELAIAVEAASKKVEANRVALEERIDIAKRKLRWYRRGTVIAVVIAIIGILVGGIGWNAGDKAQQAIDELKSQRSAARASNCKTINNGITRDQVAAQALIEATTPDENGTEQQKAELLRRINQYVHAQGMKFIDGRVIAPIIDCESYVLDPENIKYIDPPSTKGNK